MIGFETIDFWGRLFGVVGLLVAVAAVVALGLFLVAADREDRYARRAHRERLDRIGRGELPW